MPLYLVNYKQKEQTRKNVFHRRFKKFLPPKEARKPNECWNWQGVITSNGYGHIWYDDKNYQAHRVAYEIYKGEIALGLIVRHTCDNPSCVNPNHLILGTHVDNAADMVKRGRAPKGARGKLKEYEVREIKYYLHKNKKAGVIAKLARIYNVNPQTIANIKNNKTWQFIKKGTLLLCHDNSLIG